MIGPFTLVNEFTTADPRQAEASGQPLTETGTPSLGDDAGNDGPAR